MLYINFDVAKLSGKNKSSKHNGKSRIFCKFAA
jgi:hypothetical protein